MPTALLRFSAVFLRLLPLLVLLLPSWAAAFPEDVTPERLQVVELARRQGRFDFVVRELGMLISPAPHWSVGSLGAYEFEVGLHNRLGFRNVRPRGTDRTSAWDDVVEDGSASAVQALPGLSFRKGLPFSLEIGGHVDWLAASRNLTAGGYGRWVVQDGWDKVPDFAVQLGYSGLLGNDQLKLGTFELDLSMGYTLLPKGAGQSSSPTRFSPYGGYGFLMTHASPALTPIDGIVPVTAWAKTAQPGVDPGQFRAHRLFLGVEIWSGQVCFRFGADLTMPKGGPASATLDTGLALRI